ncbi:MAG: hypothetical protein JWN03_7402 [Nocardia sp.]|uniref:hypothetical protein n=1 Tax=Nocardia sp. TaxID=1821 RepID=UPI0026135BAE|nr:hypothetical protein [Nocardia sp.]MCU1647127.1 hypothetical protein [Nocardia sp.]
MTLDDRKSRRTKAALRPTDQSQQPLGLLFNIDDEGHEYEHDLLDLADEAA